MWEVLDIKSTDSYQYKYLLQDEDAVREKKQELESELSEYGEYEKELQEAVSLPPASRSAVMETAHSSSVRL